jgi:MFS family permease
VMGLSSSFYDPVSKAMLGDFVPAEKRLRVFSFRYMAVNIGFAIGPLIGSFMGLVQNNASFFITAGVYVLYGIVLLLSLRKLVLPDAKRQQTEERVTLKQALRVIRTDAALLFLLLGGVFSVTVHGQMSVTLSQYLNGNFEDGVKLFAVLMSVNAVTVVACQLFLTKMSEHWKPIKAIAIGSLLLALGEVGFATSNGWVLFLLSMFVFTIGEIFLIPAEYLALDRITPDHMRGMYYGAQTFTNLGNFIGPWFGGFLLAAYGGPVMFLVMGVISIAAIYFFWKAQRVTERRTVPEKIAF